MPDWPTCPGGHGQMLPVDGPGDLGIDDVTTHEVTEMESPAKCERCGYVEDTAT